MAKSYVTKFVEYVDNCKENLKNNLRNKGSYVDENDTLDSLVNRVGSIQPPARPEEIPYSYVRDSALPDLDAMFDADPLRYVNGGKYYSCMYGVGLYANYSTNYDISFVINWTTGKEVKFVFEKSGREVLVTNTSQPQIKLTDEDLYTLSDGTKVYIVKIYSNYGENVPVVSSGSYWYPLEVIIDNVSTAISFSNKYLKYYKMYVATNQKGLSGLSSTYMNATVVVNGNIVQTSTFYSPKELIVNGDYNGTSSNFVFNGSQGCPVKRLIVPAVSQNATSYGNCALQLSQTYYSIGSEIYIPDSYIKVYTNTSSQNSSLPIETLHIPNSLSVTNGQYDWFVGSSSPIFDCLYNVTMSDNAFALPTSTFSLYFDKMPNLTVASLTNIVNALADRTGKTAGTVRFTKVHQKKLTEEQISSLQSRNWTVSFV